MTIDPMRLKHFMFLASGVREPSPAMAELAETLQVVEEVLPYAFLRHGGFGAAPEITETIRQLASITHGRLDTPRKAVRASSGRSKDAEFELAEIIKSMLDLDLRQKELRDRFDDARRALANQSPASQGDAALRIQR